LLINRTVPWYVSAFLKLISPFIDPVTKTKIKYNEPLTDHVPAAQLMKASGGDVDFKYDHSIYWPALANMAAERKQQRQQRWEKAGKIIGESEIYLWGGDEGSVGGKSGEEKAGEVANDAVAGKGETELVDGVAGLDIKTSEKVKTTV
jgi:hypothetical protein